MAAKPRSKKRKAPNKPKDSLGQLRKLREFTKEQRRKKKAKPKTRTTISMKKNLV